jgi:hypothetical protein
MIRRSLSERENAILKLIQAHYGSQNTEDEIVFSNEGDAVIWVKAKDGSIPLMANLTNLGAWRADGTIPTQEELLRDWLRVEDT